jgi:UDP-N-acetylglucosamine transferase subunit ALG13
LIFVTVGTSEPFDRLLRALPGGAEELVVQAGESSLQREHWRRLTYVAFDELVELIRTARVVVTHAGVGTIMVALANGKRPIVMPRRAVFGEAVDDHQVGLARRLAGEGLVTFVETELELATALEQACDPSLAAVARHDGRLAADLGVFIAERLAAASTPRAHG